MAESGAGPRVFHSIHPFPSSVRSPPPGLIIAAPGETNEPKRCLRTRTAFLSLPAPPDCFAFAECGAGAARSPSPFACGCVVCGASESSGPAAGTTRSGLCCSWSRCVVGVGPGGSLQPASYRSLIALKVKRTLRALSTRIYGADRILLLLSCVAGPQLHFSKQLQFYFSFC
jgi:hypothetical protein